MLTVCLHTPLIIYAHTFDPSTVKDTLQTESLCPSSTAISSISFRSHRRMVLSALPLASCVKRQQGGPGRGREQGRRVRWQGRQLSRLQVMHQHAPTSSFPCYVISMVFSKGRPRGGGKGRA